MSGVTTAYRLVVEGLGAEAVTDAAMEQTLSDGRVRLAGLMRSGLSIEEEVNLAYAEVEASPMTAEIVDRHPDDAWTGWFARRPEATTWLSADVAASGAVNVDVLSTSEFSAGDVIHIGTEAMLVDTVASATRLTVASGGRGYWQTAAQAHYTEDGASLRQPIVTLSRPLTLERRRAFLYRYADGDDLQGDGTLIWRGVCSTDAALSEDGTTWSLTIDPITDLLTQDVGGDLDEPATIRGIYYPRNAPLYFEFFETSGPAWDSGLSVSQRAVISVAGHWETQREFCEYLTTILRDAMDPSGTEAEVLEHFGSAPTTDATEVHAHVFPTGHWGIRWSWAGVWLRVRFLGPALTDSVDGPMEPAPATTDGSIRAIVSGFGGATSQGLVPRGFWGLGDPSVLDDFGRLGTTSPFLLHLSGGVAVSGADRLAITWPGADGATVYRVDEVTESDSTVRIRGGLRERYAMYPGQLPEVRVYRSHGVGYLDTLRDSILADAPALANRGASPLITDEDVADWSDVVSRAAAGRPYARRDYVQTQAIELGEMLAHECRLLGVYPALDADGKIGLRVLELPAATSVTSFTINATNTLVSDQPPSWERGAYGTLNTVVLKTGYDPVEDKHEGRPHRVRDVAAISRYRGARELEIAPMSAPNVREPGFDQARDLAARVLGVFGRPYIVVRVQLPHTLLTSALVGTAVAVESHRLPNTSTGRRGTGNAPLVGIIRRRSWDLAREVGEVEIIAHDTSVAGYTPTVWIDSSSVVSGNQYDLTVDFDDPDDAINTLPAGGALSDFFAVGDKLEVVEWDSSTQTPQGCTVDAVTDSPATLRVTFGSAPTLTGERYVRFDQSDTPVVTGQQIYAFWADASGLVDLSTSQADASVYS